MAVILADMQGALDDPELVSGMPVGVLVVGGRFGEEKTISVAKAIDKALGR